MSWGKSLYPHSEAISPRLQFCLSALYQCRYRYLEYLASCGAANRAVPALWSWHPRVLPAGEQGWWSWSRALSCSSLPWWGRQTSVLSSRSKYFRGKFDFISFTHILKLILTTFVLVRTSCLCCLDLVSIKLSEGPFSELNRSASQLPQPSPHFWL